jgi:hypothetical protein
VFLFLFLTSPDEAVQDVLHFTQNAETILLSLSAFIGTGVGGAVLAWRMVLVVWGKRNDPVRGGKEKVQVQVVREALEKETEARKQQHERNVERLEHLQKDVDGLREDLHGVRRMLEQVLSNLLDQSPRR